MSDQLELQAKQATVARLILIGIPASLLLLVGLYAWLPPLGPTATPLDRLSLALRCDAVAALTLLAGIQTVARLRRQSEAIDPLAGKDPPSMQVHNRYVQNTLEQLVLFALGTTALSTYLDVHTARVLPALTIVFVLSRLVFWRGYLHSPPARALGMTGTFIVNLVVYGAVIFFAFRTES